LQKVDKMTQEEFKVLMEVAKDVKNVPNNRLEQTMDQLATEFESTKQNILGLSFYLDKIEELYNKILKEYQERNGD
jgi:flagellar motor switch protein FliG